MKKFWVLWLSAAIIASALPGRATGAAANSSPAGGAVSASAQPGVPRFITAGDILEISERQALLRNRLRFSGKDNRAAALTYHPAAAEFNTPAGWPVLEISEPAKLYLPDSVDVVTIESKTYGPTATAQQIKDHYLYNYILYGLFFVIVAAAAIAQP